ncbi:MAG: PLD nuclease N-terminal domain-containing protein [Syntrophobacteria bacterium]|jgi:beta-lactamase regulating signal transducer with metallopeptidase domain
MDTGVVLRILLLVGVFILLFLPTVWAIRDAARRSFPTFKAKAIWLAVVTLLPPFGAFVYIAMGRPRALTEVEKPEDTGQTTEDRIKNPK